MPYNEVDRYQKPIHKVFESVALKSPDKVAVKYQSINVTYQEILNQANLIAATLIEMGVKKGDTVGLSVSRKPELIAATIAILKCGAAYFPLDYNNPLPRNLFCLSEAKVDVIVANHRCDDLLVDGRRDLNLTEFKLDSDSAVKDGQSIANISVEVSHEDKAYVMFTSGSTGQPKGVVVPHRAVARLVLQPNYIDINGQDCILQFAPLSFDASTFEIWGALLNGATLALYSGEALDPNLFAKELEQHKVTVLWLTAALFHLFATRYLKALKPLKTLLAGGDVLNASLICKTLEAYPELTIINGYGPTENTTFTCCHRMTIQNRPKDSVPIGKPISGTNIHILDENLKPVAKGTSGSLYTSGAGVAIGYLNQPTNGGAFFKDPQIGEGTIYCTGDLVKENTLGELEFLGRQDNQVKIRGFRVSMDEIRTNLMRLNEVNDAVVMLNKFDSGEQQLVSYLQLSEGSSQSVSDIKRELALELPAYMIPDLIHINSDLPITKNGKIDRNKVHQTTNQEVSR